MTEEESYSLKKSMEALGQLVPCLKDAEGRDIDGLHRFKDKPGAWVITLKQINTPVKRTLARLAVNFCRRTMPPEELRKEIGFLIGSGLTVQNIVEQTGISERTIYRHMPERLKDKEKSEAISRGIQEKQPKVAEVTAGTSIVRLKMPPLPPKTKEPTTCNICGMGTWFAYPLKDGRKLCRTCFAYLWRQGKITEADLLKEGERPPVKPPEKPTRKPEIKEYKPPETAEFRRARMHPGVSKMELAVLEELHKRGHKVEFQKEVCLEKTVIDFIVDGKPVYLDGKRVHRNREWTDTRIRERLAKILGETVYAIPYERFTKTGAKEIVDELEGE